MLSWKKLIVTPFILIFCSTSLAAPLSKIELLQNLYLWQESELPLYETVNNVEFKDLDTQQNQLAEKFYDLGVISFNKYNPYFGKNKKVSNYLALKILFKNFGVNIPPNLDRFTAEQIQNMGIAPKAYYAKIMARAFELGLTTTNTSAFAPVDSKTFQTWFNDIKDQTYKNSGLPQKTSNASSFAVNQIPNFAVLDDVYQTIQKSYYKPADINKQKILEGAIKGMVNALEDPYSEYQTPDEFTQFVNSTQNQLEGIGISFMRIKGGGYIIMSVIPNSPAKKAGLLEGDEIMRADKQTVLNLNSNQVVNLIKGPKGSYLNLEVKRGDKLLNFNLRRDTINVPALESKLIEQKVLYLSLNKFTPNIGSQMQSILDQVNTNNLSGYILDLRSNPGGYVESAVDIADLFLPANKSVLKLNYRSLQQDKITLNADSLPQKPMYILINRGTASASEILAAALRNHFGAKLVGEKSFGKGTFQELKYFKNSSALKITIGNWTSSDKTQVEGIGLLPDFPVSTSLIDLQNGNDPTLNKAIQLLGL